MPDCTPIPVSPPFVDSMLDGRKTRLWAPIRLPEGYDLAQNAVVAHRHGAQWEVRCEPWATVEFRCPYGQPGSRLWMQESWQVVTGARAGDLGAVVRYRDMHLHSAVMPATKPLPLGLTWDRWRASTCMPRWASRLNLEVVGVEARRVQSITEEEAQAGGLPCNWSGDEPGWSMEEHGYLTPAGFYAGESGDDSPECWVWWKKRREIGLVYTAREAFRLWWDHSHRSYPHRRWEANPLVWAVTFRRAAGEVS